MLSYTRSKTGALARYWAVFRCLRGICITLMLRRRMAVCTGFEPVVFSVTRKRGLLTPLTDHSAYRIRTDEYLIENQAA